MYDGYAKEPYFAAQAAASRPHETIGLPPFEKRRLPRHPTCSGRCTPARPANTGSDAAIALGAAPRISTPAPPIPWLAPG